MNSQPRTAEHIARAILDLFAARKLPAGEAVTQLRFWANGKWSASFAFDQALRFGVERGWLEITDDATVALTAVGHQLSSK